MRKRLKKKSKKPSFISKRKIFLLNNFLYKENFFLKHDLTSISYKYELEMGKLNKDIEICKNIMVESIHEYERRIRVLENKLNNKKAEK